MESVFGWVILPTFTFLSGRSIGTGEILYCDSDLFLLDSFVIRRQRLIDKQQIARLN